MIRCILILLVAGLAGCSGVDPYEPPPPPPPPPTIPLPVGYEAIVENWTQSGFAGGFAGGDINADGRVDWQDFADLSRMDSYGVTACDFGGGDIVVAPKACPACGYVGYPPTACAYWKLEQAVDGYGLGTDPGAWLRADEVATIPDPNTMTEIRFCEGGKEYAFYCSECGQWTRIVYPAEYCELILERLCSRKDLCD